MPVELTYDTLPPGSRLRREIHQDGSVTISAPSGDVSDLMRSQTMLATGWRSALAAVALVGILVALYLPTYLRGLFRLSAEDRLILIISAGVFIVMLQLLCWMVWYRNRIDAIENRPSVAIQILPDLLRIELPDGGVTLTAPIVVRLIHRRHSQLEIRSHGKVCAELFAGLSDVELRWIASEIERITRRPQT